MDGCCSFCFDEDEDEGVEYERKPIENLKEKLKRDGRGGRD